MPTVSQKGQVTIPVKIREALGVHAGDEVTFEETDEGYVLRKQIVEGRFEKWRGAISADQAMRERMQTLRGRPLSETNADDADEQDAAAATENGSRE